MKVHWQDTYVHKGMRTLRLHFDYFRINIFQHLFKSLKLNIQELYCN